MTNDEKKNDTIIALLNSGFTQKTKVLFEKGDVMVKLVDDRGLIISIYLANDMELDVFSRWPSVDISKISAL